MTAKYTVLTVAACEPSYLQEALGHVGTFVGELKEKASCVSARYGVQSTGLEAGSIVLFQSYAGLGDVEKVFDVYAASSAYQALINSGKSSVTLRNIIKLEDVQLSNPSADMPKYGVITLVDAPMLTGERMKGFVSLFEQNGAVAGVEGEPGLTAGARHVEGFVAHAGDLRFRFALRDPPQSTSRGRGAALPCWRPLLPWPGRASSSGVHFLPRTRGPGLLYSADGISRPLTR